MPEINLSAATVCNGAWQTVQRALVYGFAMPRFCCQLGAPRRLRHRVCALAC
jgi:hypothetical protein